MAPRILIVEEALRDRQGHWFEYCRAARAAFVEELGAEVDIAGHRTMEAGVSQELQATPWFRYTVWDHIYQSPRAWRRYYGALKHNWRSYRDLNDLCQRRGPYDLLFAPTVVLHQLLALEKLTRRHAGKAIGQTVMLIRNNIASYDEAGRRSYGRTASAWRWAIRRFDPLIRQGAARFITDSSRLADEYEELTGLRFGVVPHPLVLPTTGSEQDGGDSTASQGSSSSRRVRMFLPGPARHEKGVDLLLEAVSRLEKEGLDHDVELVLQWADPFALPDGRMLSPDDARSTGRVTIETIRKPLSSEDYIDQLRRADLIVLPYRRSAYFARISGVAVEAMCLGKPVICTDDTWLSDTGRQFDLGLRVKDESVDELVAALRKAIGELAELRQRAESKVPEVRQFFSAATFASLVAGNAGAAASR